MNKKLKADQETEKAIKYDLKCIDSSRFMMVPLSDLTGNISDKLHKSISLMPR